MKAAACLPGLPLEIQDLIFDQLFPTPEERFNPQSSEDPRPATAAWRRRYGSWRDTCAALRLTCSSLSRSDSLKAALFYNLNYLTTPQSLQRVRELSQRPDLADLVKKVTFYPNPFRQTGDFDAFETLTYEAYLYKLGEQVRGHIRQEIGPSVRMTYNPEHHGPAKYTFEGHDVVDILAMEAADTRYSEAEKRKGYECFKQASEANHESLVAHLGDGGARTAIHAEYFSQLRNVEEVSLSWRENDAEAKGQSKTYRPTRRTFLYNTCPDALIRYLPEVPQRPPICQRPDARQVKCFNYRVVDVFNGTLLRPKRLFVILRRTANWGGEPHGLTTHNLGRLESLILREHYHIHLFKSCFSLTTLHAGRDDEDYQYSGGEHRYAWDLNQLLRPFPCLRSLTVSDATIDPGNLQFELLSSAQLEHLRMTNIGMRERRGWRQFFDTIRGLSDEVVFDFEAFYSGYRDVGATHYYEMHLARERSDTDLQLLAYLEGDGEWTNDLYKIWEDRSRYATTDDEDENYW